MGVRRVRPGEPSPGGGETPHPPARAIWSARKLTGYKYIGTVLHSTVLVSLLYTVQLYFLVLAPATERQQPVQDRTWGTSTGEREGPDRGLPRPGIPVRRVHQEVTLLTRQVRQRGPNYSCVR